MAAENRPARFSDLLCDKLVVTTEVTGDLAVTGSVIATVSLEASSSSSGGIVYFGTAHNRAIFSNGSEFEFRASDSKPMFAIGPDRDWLYGEDNNIMFSVGTPEITSGFGMAPTIVGTDYAFTLIPDADTGGVITFGHEFANPPSVIANVIGSAAQPSLVVTETTITLTNPTAAYTGGWMFIVAGY